MDGFSSTSPDAFAAHGLSVGVGDIVSLQFSTSSGFGTFLGVDLTISEIGQVVPEPSAVLLLSGGLLALLVFRRRS